jgi:hypothetical protein
MLTIDYSVDEKDLIDLIAELEGHKRYDRDDPDMAI